MKHNRNRHPLRRLLRLAPVVGVLLATAGASSVPSGAQPGGGGGRHDHGDAPALSQPAPARATPGRRLPAVDGTVAVQRDRTLLSVAPSTGAALAAAAAVALPQKVQLRALVVGVDAADWGVDTWKATLDRVGAAYDVLHTRTAPLSAATLIGADGVGRYNAILLSSGGLLYAEGGGYVSGLDGAEWNTLWAYERDFAVRQATLYTGYGTWPEDYCLTGAGEGGVGDAPLNTALTTAGADVFDHLKPTATVPLTQSYVYRTRITAGCAAEPILVSGADVLGVRSTSADGRQRAALTFTSNQHLIQATLLAYGLFRWASRGLYLGEQRHYLSVDIDDWFNAADHYFPDGHIESEPGYQVSGHDAYNLNTRQVALRAAYPLASGFTFTLAYNGADANLNAGTTCSPNGGVTTLTATSRCLRANFRWLNHTWTHPEMNATDYATSRREISQNRTVATRLGLSQPNAVLKTGEYSGLGVYNPNPDDDVNPPTDFGLDASNPQFLAAARDLGVRYVHGNMSFASHLPACFNCGKVHPLEPSITIVPDWPTNIAYHTTTPAEQTAFYNSLYGPGGRLAYWPNNLTYEQMLAYEADVALGHVATGSLYAHTFHIANVRDYGAGRTLVTDWVERVLARYSAYYRVPVRTPDWTALAATASARTAHFGLLSAGARAVYDPAAGTVTVTSPIAGAVTVSGARSATATAYGAEVSSSVSLAAGASASVPASPRS